MEHEKVHSARQGHDIEGWWRRYLDDAEFRLAEEIPAHIAEYQEYCLVNGDRNQRLRFAFQVAARLSGPLYGKLVKIGEAVQLVRRAVNAR